MVSIYEYKNLMNDFSDRVVGREIGDSSLATVATLIYDWLIKDVEQLSLSEDDRNFIDTKIESLESMREGSTLNPGLCDGVDDICSKVISLQERVRDIQSRTKTGSVTK